MIAAIRYAHGPADLEPTGAWLARNIPARIRPPAWFPETELRCGAGGLIVERVSVLPFEQYIEDRVFRPLGMDRSTFRQSVSADWNRTSPRTTPTPTERSGRGRSSWRIPATGEGHTTVTDMARFMIADLQSADSPILLAATLQQLRSRAPWLAALEGPVGPAQALLMTSVYFGLAHFYGVPYGIVGVVMAFIPGWLMENPCSRHVASPGRGSSIVAWILSCSSSSRSEPSLVARN